MSVMGGDQAYVFPLFLPVSEIETLKTTKNVYYDILNMARMYLHFLCQKVSTLFSLEYVIAKCKNTLMREL